MILFKKVRYKNFLSTGNQFIEIDLDKSNTTLVVGENGAGKSTMLDALCFGLFQRAFRGIKKDQLVNSINEKDCVVEVEFTVGQKNYKIIRGIKPNKFEIWCNGNMLNQDAAQRDYQKHLEQQILKLNFRSFTQVVILGNASFVPFMQLRARHRRQVVEEILDIEIFSKMNLLLREKQKNQDELIKQTDFNFQLVDNKIDDKRKYIDDISNRSKDLADSKKADLDKSMTDISNYEEDIKRVRTDIAKLQKLVLDSTKITAKHNKLHSMEAKLENTCNKHKKDLTFFESHDDCPTCQQSINAVFKTTMINKKAEKVQELEIALGQIDKEIKTSQMKLDTINKTMVSIREKELLINRYETSIEEIKKQTTKLEQEIAELQDEKVSTAEQTGELNQLVTQSSQLEKDKIDQKREMLYIDTARHLMQDSGIKTKIIKQYLPIMNQLINKYLMSMDFYVNFNLDENFTETIKSRFRDTFNYASFSEGEKMRIDLALLFTWRAIAKMKNSTNTNLLILDEIFDSSLDGQGTDEFLRILNTLSEENTFVISHKGDQLADKFRHSIRFTKEQNFSRIA